MPESTKDGGFVFASLEIIAHKREPIPSRNNLVDPERLAILRRARNPISGSQKLYKVVDDDRSLLHVLRSARLPFGLASAAESEAVATDAHDGFDMRRVGTE